MRSTDLWRRTLNAVSTQATATIKQALGAPSTTRSAVPADQPLHWEWLARACSPASTVPVHVRSATCAALSNRSSSAHAAADQARGGRAYSAHAAPATESDERQQQENLGFVGGRFNVEDFPPARVYASATVSTIFQAYARRTICMHGGRSRPGMCYRSSPAGHSC